MPQIRVHAARHEHVAFFLPALNQVVEIGAQVQHRGRVDALAE